MIFAHRENNDVAVVKAEDNLQQFNSLHNAISNKVLSMGRARWVELDNQRVFDVNITRLILNRKKN